VAISIATEGKYYFLSRPRRFGKSMLISTLDCLFKAQKDLFKGLYIEDRWDWDSTNPVLRISFSNIGHKEKGLELAIHDELIKIASQYNITLKATHISSIFKELIETLSTTLGKIVVLIDEYDKPIIDYLGTDTAKAIENRNVMKTFYSILKDADPFLKLVFITGVSKFSKVSIFSDLNNLYDLSIDDKYAGVCGITQKELDDSFAQELKVFDREEIKAWYNGYSWDLKNKVYNPFSLLNFFKNKTFKNYWFESGSPSFLIELCKSRMLYNFENIAVSLDSLSSYDLEKLQLIPLMYQTGYLTFKSYSAEDDMYTLDYPNKEVRNTFLNILLENFSYNDLSIGKGYAVNLRNALSKNNLNDLHNIFNAIFKSIPYTLWQQQNENFYHALIHLTFRLLGIYVQSEIQSADGRLDALVIMDKYIYCFEFKLNGNAQAALQQIKDKQYLLPYIHEPKKCIGIGVNFSIENKKIEEIVWEEFN
jgi:hypothetical protein